MGMITMGFDEYNSNELTQIDGGQYIYAVYRKKGYNVNGVKIFSLAFDLNAISGGTGGFVELFSYPNDMVVKEGVSEWLITKQGKSVQISINNNGKISINTESTITRGDGMAVNMVAP